MLNTFVLCLMDKEDTGLEGNLKLFQVMKPGSLVD